MVGVRVRVNPNPHPDSALARQSYSSDSDDVGLVDPGLGKVGARAPRLDRDTAEQSRDGGRTTQREWPTLVLVDAHTRGGGNYKLSRLFFNLNQLSAFLREEG